MAIELSGQPVANDIAKDIQAAVKLHQAHRCQPKMVTILVEGDAASAYYVQAKGKMAARLGIAYEVKRFFANVQLDTLLECIQQLNQDDTVHGIMLELPLPAHIDTEKVIASINPKKDIDGLTLSNRLAILQEEAGLYPATPLACIALAKYYGITFPGKNVTVVGCGKTVGKPLMHLLLQENATVTICHAATRDLKSHILGADILYVAVGKANLVTPEMVHPNLIVIDVGMNELPNGKIVGDVDPLVAKHVAAMTPTPGGIGKVTTVQLFANLMQAIYLQQSVLCLV